MPVTRERGEGGLFKKAGSRFWYAQYYQDGRPIRVSTKTDSKEKALKFLRALLTGKDNGAAPADEIRNLRYSDIREMLIAHYEAKGKKSLRLLADGRDSVPGLAALDEFCGFKTDIVDGKRIVVDEGVPVTSLTTEFARRFVKKRLAEEAIAEKRRNGDADAGNAVINRSLAALRRMLNLARLQRKITNVPYIEFQKEPKARKGFLERDDFNRLIAVLPTHLRPLVTFLYWCGCRIGETLSITWGQVDLDAPCIRLEEEQTKGDEPRIIPLPSELVALLREVESDDSDAKVFDGTNLRKEWMKACALVGLGKLTEIESRPYDPQYTGLTLHDLRRSGVRNMRKANVPESVAMKISGHKTRSVFERYNIVDESDVLDAMKKVEVAALGQSKKPVVSGKVIRGRLAAKAGK